MLKDLDLIDRFRIKVPSLSNPLSSLAKASIIIIIIVRQAAKVVPYGNFEI